MINDIHIGLAFCAGLLAFGIIGAITEWAVMLYNERKGN